MRLPTLFAPLVLLLIIKCASAQFCNPAAVHYIVRDERGRILTEAQLKTIADQLPREIDDANVSVSDVSFASDKRTYYWPETVDYAKGTKVAVLLFANASTCTLHFTEATLQYRGKQMRLIFNIDIARKQEDRRPVIDSLKFQNGTFKLDLTRWSHNPDKLIPATRWRKIGRTP